MFKNKIDFTLDMELFTSDVKRKIVIETNIKKKLFHNLRGG